MKLYEASGFIDDAEEKLIMICEESRNIPPCEIAFAISQPSSISISLLASIRYRADEIKHMQTELDVNSAILYIDAADGAMPVEHEHL